jgi:hypothetical protein
MTLEEGKRKVLMLLDEYSSGGTITTDADIDAKMNDFFDTAQKQVCALKPIRKLVELQRVSGQTAYDMPADFRKLCCIYRNGKRTQRYVWRGGKLIIPESDTATVEIEYFAFPTTITPDTQNSYVFEVAEDAAQACPFYVASQQLISDLVLDYQALRNEWVNALSLLTPENPGGVQLQQVFFTGR